MLVCAAQQEVFHLFFFPYKVKTVLFVSSGPKPCEACRQEEIYEEPISILNSNEVSHEVFDFNVVSSSYFMRDYHHHPCCFTEKFLTGFPHDNKHPRCNHVCLVCLPLKLLALVKKKNNRSLLTGISRQCCRTRNSKSPRQMFEPGL